MRVLLSAYACRPGASSEPGVGWHTACALARSHQVWVITRSDNRQAIESSSQACGARFAYCDLPAGLGRSLIRNGGRQMHYYLWQLAAGAMACLLQARIGFDVAHHVTYARYWVPSLLAWLNVPLVFGPVGGADRAPSAFRARLPARARAWERLRDLARTIGECDPLVRGTVRRCAAALAATEATWLRLKALGAPDVRVLGCVALSQRQIEELGSAPRPAGPCRFISIGRLLCWKGFDLGLRAFALARLAEAEYWIVGDGPEGGRLRELAAACGIGDRVRFWGAMPHEEAMELLKSSTVLVHPSLHDSGGLVCLEAMAAGRPVICLDLGGPGQMVTEATGIRIAGADPQSAVEQMAAGMRLLAREGQWRLKLGQAGRRRVELLYRWESRVLLYTRLYEELVGCFRGRAGRQRGLPLRCRFTCDRVCRAIVRRKPPAH